MDDLTVPLPGLSPVLDKDIIARFDGGSISLDGGLLVLREVQRRSGLAHGLAACLDDPRDPTRIQHTLADMIAFRPLMIAAGGDGRVSGRDRRQADGDARLRSPVLAAVVERGQPIDGERNGWGCPANRLRKVVRHGKGIPWTDQPKSRESFA